LLHLLDRNVFLNDQEVIQSLNNYYDAKIKAKIEDNLFQSKYTLIELTISEKIYLGKSTGTHLA
jgi:hypothetical protein